MFVPKEADAEDPYLGEDPTEAEIALKCLESMSWSVVGGCFRGTTPPETTEQEMAGSLARRMDAKMENTMKRSARVTALALNLHKPGLMQELIVALSGVKNDVSLLRAAREAVAQSWPR